ncbi:MAG: RnfH family protein [Rhodospirillaceae bacterium]
MDKAEPDIVVEVVYATPDGQRLYRLHVPSGTTVRAVIERCGIKRDHPELDVDACPLGIFGERVAPTAEVEAGDRIELYRPLIADPKETRRRRAAKVAKG